MQSAAVIVASGESARMGFDKLLAPIDGVPVLRRSVDAFRACDFIGPIVVVCPPDRFAACKLEEGGQPPLIRVDGGANRQDSVARGVSAVPEEAMYIAVHDGARPLVTPDIISECLNKAQEFGAAAAARPVTETLKRSDVDGFSRESVSRTQLWFTETPQIFRARILRRACQAIVEQDASVTDEVSAVELLGISSYLVRSQTPNIKITRPPDIDLAEHFLA